MAKQAVKMSPTHAGLVFQDSDGDALAVSHESGATRFPIVIGSGATACGLTWDDAVALAKFILERAPS
jgi:hypothetical protein